mmetsp:Transcript_11085/g.32886  ORF Transcript_11085/g.32886 Transcript_11085/m.32886 type:complete len:152 (+) Transcript_11085:448-903(+)
MRKAGEMRLPFSAGEASLSRASGWLWPVAELTGSGGMDVCIGGAFDLPPPVQLASFEVRAVAAAALQAAAPLVQHHLYQTGWQRAGEGAAATAVGPRTVWSGAALVRRGRVPLRLARATLCEPLMWWPSLRLVSPARWRRPAQRASGAVES